MKEPEQRRVFVQIIHFRGRVQGVGFRYKTLRIAHGFSVTGEVRNLSDGRVRLEVEGEESEVRAFVANVQDTLSTFIRGVEEESHWRSPQLQEFRIS